MTAKKVFGYIFIVVAIFLTLVTVALIPKLLGAIIGFFKIFNGSLDNYEIGRVIGKLIYWVLHFALTITLWVYGRRWIKNNRSDDF
ncbi:hypothetical protein SanaruYs_18220 [Chryseotalea sanaruensis]|uniref:Uncharacterized protein n=1 Tax=Chryseotalea sanaruensis TaxID=2482724 RepID=A0A401U9L7_9BACT|nr:hypothetical protein [Chryseotalea sanaruensis]GCC51596.1 hypothetical protein SanaruYs_18220 [Chryseotalea sanaruensis]